MSSDQHETLGWDLRSSISLDQLSWRLTTKPESCTELEHEQPFHKQSRRVQASVEAHGRRWLEAWKLESLSSVKEKVWRHGSCSSIEEKLWLTHSSYTTRKHGGYRSPFSCRGPNG